MKIFNGKKISEDVLTKLARKTRRKKYKLAVVLVGKDLSSRVFVRKKREACEEIGIDFELFEYPQSISKAKLKREIKKIAKKADVSGIVIQLPLPKGFNDQEFLNLVPSEKDPDVLSEANIAKFYTGTLNIYPPVVAAIRYFLKEYKISPKKKNIVLVGAGRLVGRPMLMWLLREKATVSVVSKQTKNIPYFTKKADIVISGTGCPNLITGKMIKKGAVVIDAGCSKRRKKVTGDVDFKTVSKKASYLTPVPGGVGPVTIACLLENLIKLNKKSGK